MRTAAQLVSFHRRAQEEFGARLARVSGEQWNLPTPCDRWAVRGLTNHVVAWNARVPAMVEGEPLGPVDEQDWLGTDPLSAWSTSAATAQRAFEGEGAFDRVVHMPAGDVTARYFVFSRVDDVLTHAWDLARAVGGDERLDAELVVFCLEGLEPLASAMAASGVFAPAVEVSPAASAQVRMLALQGRDCRRAVERSGPGGTQ